MAGICGGLAIATTTAVAVAVAQDGAGEVCGDGGGNKITLCDMWDRELPDGTQVGHQAYHSTGMYYYHRPYNASHYRQHRMRLQRYRHEPIVDPSSNPERQRNFVAGFQYADSRPEHLFRPFVRQPAKVDSIVTRPTDSSVLEFADWRRYESAERAWLQTRDYETTGDSMGQPFDQPTGESTTVGAQKVKATLKAPTPRRAPASDFKD